MGPDLGPLLRNDIPGYSPGESSDEGDYKCNLFVNLNANRKEREMLKDTLLGDRKSNGDKIMGRRKK